MAQIVRHWAPEVSASRGRDRCERDTPMRENVLSVVFCKVPRRTSDIGRPLAIETAMRDPAEAPARGVVSAARQGRTTGRRGPRDRQKCSSQVQGADTEALKRLMKPRAESLAAEILDVKQGKEAGTPVISPPSFSAS